MNELEVELKELLADCRNGHSDLQMDSFITYRTGEGHLYGMYQQSLRELNSRYISLKESFWDLDLLELDLKGAEQKTKRSFLFGRCKRKRLKVELERLCFKKECLLRRLRETDREFRRFWAQAKALKKELGPINGRAQELDRDLWKHKIKFRMAVDLLREGRPSASLLELIPSLPKELREDAWRNLKNSKETTEWFQNLCFDGLALPDLADLKSLRELLP